MQLRRGVQLYSDLPGIADQLLINEGTMLPAAEAESGFYYHPGSYIPRRQWRVLAPSEMKTLLTRSKHADFRKSICVGNIPDDLKDAFLTLELDEVSEVDKVMPQIRKKEQEVIRLNEKLDEFLRPFSSDGNFKFHRITRAMPDRETITCHYRGGRHIYIGLHIDQSRLFTPHTAYRSGNRISINLSKERRYLAFVNLSVLQVYRMIKEKASDADPAIDSYNIGSLFFKYYPDYPVIKIGLNPFQYYIAPTDNFFHDATTAGNQAIDITIVYTGVFDKLN